MQRNSFLSRMATVLVAIGALGLTISAVAGDAVPIKGVADAVVTDIEPAEDGLHFTLAATGVASHLGEFTREEHLVLQADGSFVGSVTFIASNGDRLSADFSGGFTSPTTAVGTYQFAGGTGRFRDAAGFASWVGVTSDGIHVAVTFEGTISY